MSENNQFKKVPIIIAVVIILFLIVFAVSKFFTSKTNNSIEQLVQSETTSSNDNLIAKSRLAKTFAQKAYTIIYNINDPETNTSLEILFVKDGEKMFTQSTYGNLPNQQNSVLVVGEDYYSIDHANKKIYHNQAAAEEEEFNFIDDNFQEDTLISSQETIDNITYDTEDFGDGSIFYFLKDQLKMIKDKETNSTIIVKSYSATVDQSVFVLPSDYKMEEQADQVYINDDQITQEDLEALKAQGVEINPDELGLDSLTNN